MRNEEAVVNFYLFKNMNHFLTVKKKMKCYKRKQINNLIQSNIVFIYINIRSGCITKI